MAYADWEPIQNIFGEILNKKNKKLKLKLKRDTTQYNFFFSVKANKRYKKNELLPPKGTYSKFLEVQWRRFYL